MASSAPPDEAGKGGEKLPTPTSGEKVPSPLASVLADARRTVLRLLPVLDRYRAARQFVKFCVVGATNLGIDLTIYYLLTRGFGWYFLTASLTSFLFAVSWSFYWNRRWTFRLAGGSVAGQYPKFVLTNAVSGGMQNALLYGLVEGLGWYDLYAKGLAIVFAAVWNFTVTKFWAFRR